MGSRLNKETTKIHLHLFTEDLEFIDEMFCRAGLRTVGRSPVIRNIVHAWAQQLKRKSHAKSVAFDPAITALISEPDGD